MYDDYEIQKIVEWLQAAEKILDSDHVLKIHGAKAAIHNALRLIEDGIPEPE